LEQGLTRMYGQDALDMQVREAGPDHVSKPWEDD
jgi:hypothetical protein